MGHVVAERIAHPNTEVRSDLYTQATDAAFASPVLGHGAPLPSSVYGPSVGTHGQLWTLLVSQRFPGLTLFVGFFVTMLLLTWRMSIWGLWPHAALVVALSQPAVYNLLPVQLHTVAIVIVLALRDVLARRPAYDAERLSPPQSDGLLPARSALSAR